MLMMWDGLGFFGFDDTKLPRLKGKKITFCTPFKSWKNTPFLIIGLTVMAFIIVMEVDNLGKQKSQTIDLRQEEAYEYDIEKAMPLIGATWFFVKEVFPKAQAFQKKTKGDGKSYQYKGPTWKLLPLKHEEWDWFDNDYFSHYICDHTKFYYQFQRFFDAVGTETYSENSKFMMKCQTF